MKGLILLISNIVLSGSGSNVSKMDNNHHKIQKEDNAKFTYDDIIDLLITGQKIKNDSPKMDVHCCIAPNIINHNDIHIILSSYFDRVITCDKNSNEYNRLIKDYSLIKKCYINEKFDNEDTDNTDENYVYFQIKNKLGPYLTNHTMFKEKDIEIYLRNGINFDEKK